MPTEPMTGSAIQFASDLWKRVIDGAPEAILIVDRSGEILFSNRNATALFGYSGGELSGRSVELLLPERFRSRHAQDRRTFVDSRRIRATSDGIELDRKSVV